MKNGDYILIIAPSDYPGKLYRNRYCLEHHYVYWKYYGILTNDDEIIHHLNGDKFDNSIENLQLLKRSKHSSEHIILKKRKCVLLKCPYCEKIFVRFYNQTHLGRTQIGKKAKSTFCCRQCVGSFGKFKLSEKKTSYRGKCN